MSKILKVVGASWLQTKVSSYILGVLGILAILALFAGQIERIQEDGNYSATVFYSEKTGYRIEYWGQSNELAELPRGVARAYFRRDVDTTGWSLLEVETNASYPDEIQAYAAGIVEGALTWSLIHTHLSNTIGAKCADQKMKKKCEKLRDAFDKSVNIWKTQASEKEDEDPFWHHVSLHYTQISGVFTGWKHGVERSQKEYETDISDLYWLNSIAEAVELQHKLNISLEDAFDNLPDLSSAFVRMVNETAEDGTHTAKLYVAQNAAGSYSAMNRILKHYKLNYRLTAQEDSVAAPRVSIEFSAYPGAVTSQDEFYILAGERHRLAVAGVALRNYDANLWKNVDIDGQLPLAPRVSAANRLATNASSWAHAIATYNSGTGAKQWLVVDFDRFDRLRSYDQSRQAELRNVEPVTTITELHGMRHIHVHRATELSELLVLVEQAPGLTHSRDLTAAFLKQQYWATIGLPITEDIKKATHVAEMEDLYGNVFSASKSPRAVIFNRGYKNASSLDTIIKLMRQNNVTALNSAGHGSATCEGPFQCIVGEPGYWAVLGARGDLVSGHRRPYGVIDTKVVSGTTNSKKLEFVAVASPPYTEVAANATRMLVNKGNLATIYTDQFDNQPTIDTVEIRNQVEQQQEKAEQEALEILNRNIVQPFQWSESDFKDVEHDTLPDKWAFQPFTLKWHW